MLCAFPNADLLLPEWCAFPDDELLLLAWCACYLMASCYYLHDRHDFPNMYDVRFLMNCFYLYDRHVLPRHGDLLLEEIVGRSLGRPHSPDARHHGYPGLFSSTAFGTHTTTLLRFPAAHNITFAERFDEVWNTSSLSSSRWPNCVVNGLFWSLI